jgi:hypothetical protein
MNYEEISIREFGRRTGEVDTTIRRFKEKGIIPAEAFGIHPKNGRPTVYYELAYTHYAAFRGIDPTPPSFKEEPEPEPAPVIPEEKPKKKTAGQVIKEENERQAPTAKTPKPGAGNADALNTSAQYAQADLREKKAKAELAELNLEEKRGNLVPKAEVTKNLYEFGAVIKNQILSVPDRVIDSVYSAADRGEAHRILTFELTDALTRLSDIDKLKLTNKKV